MKDPEESEVSYKDIVDNSFVGIFQSNLAGRVLFVNDMLVKLMEHDSAEEMMARLSRDFYGNPAEQTVLWQTLKKKGRADEFTMEVISGKGNSKFIRLIATLKDDVITGIVIDVTEMKRVEDALRESEEKYRVLVDNSPTGIFQSTVDGILLFVNDALLEMFEYKSVEDVVSRNVFRFYKNPDDRKHIIQRLKKDRKISDVPLEMVTQTGKALFVHLSATLEGDLLTGTILDVTQRLLAEKELSRTRAHLRHVISSSPSIIYSCSLESGGKRKSGYVPTFVSDNIERLLGYKAAECLGKREWWAKHLHPDDVRGAVEKMKQLFLDGSLTHEYRVRHRNGDYRWVRDDLVLVRGADGVPTEFVGSWSDITEQKEMMIALQASEEQWRALTQNSPDYVTLLGTDLRIQFINRTLPGLKADEIVGTMIHKLSQKKNQTRFKNTLKNVLATGEPARYSAEYIAPDGQVLHFESHISALSRGSRVVGLIMSSHEVTERHKAELALKESEEQWRSLAENSPDHIVLLDRDLVVRYLNFCAPGLKVEDIVGTTAYSYYPGEKQSEVRKMLQGVLRTGETATYYTEYRLPSGEMSYYESLISARVIEGESVGITISTRDITERRRSEDALKESEKKYRNLVDTAIVGIIQSTMDGELLFANQAVADMAGFDTPEELIAQGALPRYKDPRQREEWIEGLRKHGSVDNVEVEMLDRHGNICYGLLGAVIDGGIITSVTIDITDRVKADRELAKSQKQLRNLTRKLETVREEERAGLAREIHDELGQSMTALKMNLAWLRGKLLKGQNDLSDKVKLLEDIVDDNLQVVKKISSELRPTLLDDLGLAAAIEWHSQDFQKKTRIRCMLTLEPDDFELDPDRSTTLFRIYQEAMTNIYRHAQATGVMISLSKDTDNVVLSISDNGRGIKDENISNARSLGIVGMRERVYHWDGCVDIRKKRKGTVVTIAIPLGR